MWVQPQYSALVRHLWGNGLVEAQPVVVVFGLCSGGAAEVKAGITHSHCRLGSDVQSCWRCPWVFV